MAGKADREDLTDILLNKLTPFVLIILFVIYLITAALVIAGGWYLAGRLFGFCH